MHFVSILLNTAIFPFTPQNPFTKGNVAQHWTIIGIVLGALVGIPLFFGALIGYVSENIKGRPPREELDKLER